MSSPGDRAQQRPPLEQAALVPGVERAPHPPAQFLLVITRVPTEHRRGRTDPPRPGSPDRQRLHLVAHQGPLPIPAPQRFSQLWNRRRQLRVPPAVHGHPLQPGRGQIAGGLQLGEPPREAGILEPGQHFPRRHLLARGHRFNQPAGGRHKHGLGPGWFNLPGHHHAGGQRNPQPGQQHAPQRGRQPDSPPGNPRTQSGVSRDPTHPLQGPQQPARAGQHCQQVAHSRQSPLGQHATGRRQQQHQHPQSKRPTRRPIHWQEPALPGGQGLGDHGEIEQKALHPLLPPAAGPRRQVRNPHGIRQQKIPVVTQQGVGIHHQCADRADHHHRQQAAVKRPRPSHRPQQHRQRGEHQLGQHPPRRDQQPRDPAGKHPRRRDIAVQGRGPEQQHHPQLPAPAPMVLADQGVAQFMNHFRRRQCQPQHQRVPGGQPVGQPRHLGTQLLGSRQRNHPRRQAQQPTSPGSRRGEQPAHPGTQPLQPAPRVDAGQADRQGIEHPRQRFTPRWHRGE